MSNYDANVFRGYHADPTRRCGRKKKGGFYMEGGAGSSFGTLFPWTWALPSGLVSDAGSFPVPPRKPLFADIAATLTSNELFELTGDSVIAKISNYSPSADEKDLYSAMKKATRTLGAVDHVGVNSYTPFSFSKEVRELGPSRRITPATARITADVIQRHGPIPILFTSSMPLFRSLSHIREGQALIDSIATTPVDWSGLEYYRSWQGDNWGQYRMNQHGGNHWLIPFLRWADAVLLPEHWLATKESEPHKRLKDFLKDSVVWAEQPLGLSWIVNCTYIKPDNGEVHKFSEHPKIATIELEASSNA